MKHGKTQVKTELTINNRDIENLVDRNNDNIMLLAFRHAVSESLTVQNMVDGFSDEFEDETGIDTGASIDESYDSINDFYQPFDAGSPVLLLHMNGANNSTVFTDSAPSPHTITPNGDVKISTAQSKFGGASAFFDGSGDYLTTPDSPDWDILASTSANWTIDLWVKHTALGSAEYYITQSDTGNLNRWFFLKGSANQLQFGTGDAFSGFPLIGGTITNTDWNHVAFIKVGTQYGLYLNGTQVAFGSSSETRNFNERLLIGARGEVAVFFKGYMDELRIVQSNIFSAAPNSGLTNTITVPSAESSTGIQNMTLFSINKSAVSQPSNARLILFEEDVSSITLNTDLKAYVSRDGGTTYSQVTLTDIGNYESNKRLLANNVDISSQPTGTTMKFKIETANNKNLKLHGVGLSWD